MFNKQQARPGAINGVGADLTVSRHTPESAPPVRKGPRVASIISDDLVIEGAVIGAGELHVDGVIRGDVDVPRLTIGESGRIEGAIRAETVETRGWVLGSITALQVKLAGSSHVEGDITHEQLTMEAGAYFQGRSLKLKREPAPALTEAQAVEAAQNSLVNGELPSPAVDAFNDPHGERPAFLA